MRTVIIPIGGTVGGTVPDTREMPVFSTIDAHRLKHVVGPRVDVALMQHSESLLQGQRR